ncbi:M13 family metallopeptidase N-terminal domain-containing protein, partial [Cronobacter muytjensii]
RKAYSVLVAEANEMGIAGPYSQYVWSDDKKPERMVLLIDQGGTGLPDRDMYLSDKPAFVKMREAYVAHLANVLTLAGEKDVEARARAILTMETEIAKVHWTREDASDMGKTYHKYTIAETAQFASPTLDLQAILKAAGGT